MQDLSLTELHSLRAASVGTQSPALRLADNFAQDRALVEVQSYTAAAESLQNRVLEAEELAGMATLLAGDDGRGITGQVISVDGGYKV